MNLILRDLYYNKLCSSVFISSRIRKQLLNFGGTLGKGITIMPRCFIGNSNLPIGDHTFVNYNVWFNKAGGIKIGSSCNIAYKVTFVTPSHEIS